MKIPTVKDATITTDWNDTKEKSPENVRELYIVVQEIEGGEPIRNAAYWEQDGNGDWGWNKANISHWMKWPEMPK